MTVVRLHAALLGLVAFAVPALAGASGQHAEHADHSQHEDPAQHSDHSQPSDHSQHAAHAQHAEPSAPAEDASHAGHAGTDTTPLPRTPISVPTDTDRAAAVRPAGGHAAHDRAAHHFVLFDRLEAGRGDGHDNAAWAVHAWWGGDVDRVWLRSEGERAGGTTERGDIEVLWGHGVTPWWDVVAGARRDFGEGPAQTFAAFGVQGLAPYKIETAITAYVGEGGQTGLRAEAEYDTLLGDRLILQWLVEAEAYGQRDERRGLGAGLNSVEAGARLRYEIRREFAPYVGVAWERVYGDLADDRRADGDDVDEVRFVAGVRFWF